MRSVVLPLGAPRPVPRGGSVRISVDWQHDPLADPQIR